MDSSIRFSAAWICGVATRAVVKPPVRNGVAWVDDDVRRSLGADTIDGKEALQVFEFIVGERTVLVLWAHHSELARDDALAVAAAAQAKTGLPLVVVLNAVEGRLGVDLSFCDVDEQERDAALMAAAVSQKSHAWDESERIVVAWDGGAVEVTPHFSDGSWRASVK